MPPKPPKTKALEDAQVRLGARVKSVRNQIGLTQTELGLALGKGYPATTSWISEIESGRNGVDALTLQRIADVLSYPIAYFTDEKYDVRRPQWPKSLSEWTMLAGGDEPRARAHFELDHELVPG